MPSRRHSLLDPHTAAFPPLEVRTVTLGVNVADLADSNLDPLCRTLYQRVIDRAGSFGKICSAVAAEFGVPILQRRVCVTPLDRISEGFGADDLVNIARTLDGAAAHVHVDQIAGYLARVPHGMSSGARQMIAALPAVLSQTDRVQAAVEAASSASGIPLGAVELLGYKLKETAEATADRQGIGAAKLSILANLPSEGPPISGVFPGDGWGDLVVHVSVSSMSAIRHAIEQRLARTPQVDMGVLAADIKAAAFQSVRVAELIGREIARRLTADFGCVDVSLAPTVRPGQTIAELLQRLGIASFGSPGTAAALMMLWNAVRAAGTFASAAAAGSSAVLLPVLRDAGLVAATEAGSLAIEHLEHLATVGGLGLDLIPVPGDTDARTLSALMADQLATAVANRRPTVIRLVPVPGKRAGERVSFGRDLGDAIVLPVASATDSTFVQRGGRIPGFR